MLLQLVHCRVTDRKITSKIFKLLTGGSKLLTDATMSSSRKSITDFLMEAKQLSEQTSSCDRLDIVLGNESCDLDSAVSALLYGFYLSKQQNDVKNVIPMLNIPASQLAIKSEVVYFLQANHIPLDCLIFRDSLDLEQLSRSCPLSVTLVDHHVLAGRDRFLAPFVREVIDHRPVLEAWPQLEAKTMDIVGSCVTHVARKMLDNCPELIRDSVNVANLIYGTILLDTACLSPQAKRATPADFDIVTCLKALHPRHLQPESELFECLQTAKSDVSHLTLGQLLIKDLKLTKQGVPIVGLPILVQDFLKKNPADLKATLDKFLLETPAPLVVLMGQTITEGTITRDLGMYGPVPESVKSTEAILTLLRSNQNPALNLEELERDSIVRVFRVHNVQVSRKQLLPLVEKALD